MPSAGLHCKRPARPSARLVTTRHRLVCDEDVRLRQHRPRPPLPPLLPDGRWPFGPVVKIWVGFLSLHLLVLQQRTMPHGYCTIWDDRALLIMFYYVVAGMRFLLGTTTRQRAQRSYRCFYLNCGPFVQQALHSLCFWSPDIKMKGGHAIATNRDRHDCRAQHISA